MSYTDSSQHNSRHIMLAFVFLLSLIIQIDPVNCVNLEETATMPQDRKPIEMGSIQDVENILADSLIQFSGNMFKSMNKSDMNLIMSPMSIHMALNLMLVGAEPNSQTEKELLGALGYSSLKAPVEMVHKAYAKLAESFKEISEVAKKEAKERQKEKEGDLYFGPSKKTPILDLWSLAITKKAQLLPAYVEYLQKHYNGSIEALTKDNPNGQQKLLERVNAWGKEAGFPNGLLTNKELMEDFRILLLSAVRVEAFWDEPFREHKLERLFYNNGSPDQLIKDSTGLVNSDIDGSVVEFVAPGTTKMKRRYELIKSKHSANLQELSKHNFRAINIPLYGNMSYTIIEPLDQPKGNNLGKLASALLSTSSGGQSLLQKALLVLDSEEAKTEFEYIAMPKFKFESSIDLISPLKSLGILRMFDRERAQLTKMSTEKLCVERAKHDAVFEVNKFGLKAAGVTKIKIVPMMAVFRDEPVRLEIKNPFIFIIRFGKLPLFIGQLTKLSS